MANLSPDQVVQKYQRGVANAAPDYAAGVENPSRSWSQATIAGASRWQAGVQLAAADGRFSRGVQAAGDQKWQQAASTKGAQRYAAAAQDAAQGYAAVVAKVMAAGAEARRAAASLPNTTIEQRIARAAASMRASSAYWQGQRR